MDSDSDSIRSLQSTQSDLEDEQFNELYDLIDLNDWTYNAFSNRGCDFAGNLRSIIRSESSIKLEYDLTDLFIFSRTKIEIGNALSQVRKKLFDSDRQQNISFVESFCGSLPHELLIHFCTWLKACRSSSDAMVTFADICEFLRCDLLMRVLDISASSLSEYNISSESIIKYKRVKKCMQNADKPCSSRPAVMHSAQFPAFTFDPIMDDVISCCSREYIKLFYVRSVSWVDLDDDKLPNSSPKWKKFGMRMIPTKDKKLKPVIHIVATVGSGFIIQLFPDKIGSSLAKIMRSSIENLCPSFEPSSRSSLIFFIDRGYLSIAKKQSGEVLNLVQIMTEMGVKFLGTVRNTNSLNTNSF